MTSGRQSPTTLGGGSPTLRNAATRTTIDGVTTLFLPLGGTSRATLSFRVGTADEPLHQRGINHLIGHLASAAADQDDSACHVTVSASTLSFSFAGNALAVANEIGAVCHWVTTASTAPVDERALQRARAAAAADQRPHAPEHLRVLRARFGPAGWAAGYYPELGLESLSAEDVMAWVTRYLTGGNAVLALTGTKATTLRVPLPSGGYLPPATLPVGFLTTPAIVPSDEPMLSLSGLIPTEAAHLDRDRAVAGLTAEITRSRIAHALSRRYGETLRVRGGPMSLGPSAVHAVVHAQVEADREAKVADIAAEALSVLVTDGLLDTELGAHVKRRMSAYERAAASGAGQHEILHRQALGALNDAPWSLALERRMLSNATAEDVTRQLEQLAASTVLMMADTEPPVRPWALPAPESAFAAAGQVFRSRPAYGVSSRHRPSRLILGEEGVTLRRVNAPDAQLRWQSVAMVQSWDDGRLLLTGGRTQTLDIVPEQWLAADLATGAVREALAGSPVVAMGPRSTPTPAPIRITDRFAPAWWWAGAGLGAVLLIMAALPIWSDSVSWMRWIVGAAGIVALVVGGAWAYDTAITERRLRSPGRPAPAIARDRAPQDDPVEPSEAAKR